MSVELRHFTLTSDGSGDATGSDTTPITGKLVKIEVENDSSDTPSDNWDLTVYTGTDGGNDDEVLFLDETVSNSKVSKVVYYPVATASVKTDGSDSSLTEVKQLVIGKVIKGIGANMGASKTAVVRLIFEKN